MSDIRQRLLEAFEVEHREHLEIVRQWLAGVEAAGWDTDADDMADSQRRLHSLKGAARAVEMPVVETLAHDLESLLGALKRGEVELDGRTGALITEGLDCVEDCVAARRGGEAMPDVTDFRERLGSLTGREMPPVAEPVEQRAEPALAGVTGDAASAVADPSAEPFPGSVRVDVETLDNLLEAVGEIDAEINRMTDVTGELAQCLGLTARLERMDSGVDAGQRNELVARLLEGLRAACRRHERAAWQQRQSMRRLGKQATSARMVTVGNLFGGARKMVRDLARDTGRRVAVTVTGLENVADRRVLQTLTDPVTHMLRNAVSHGIEPPEEREAAGKPPEGHVRLTFRTDNARLYVTVEDDGRGLDRKSIAAQVEQAGLDPGDAADLSAEEMLEWICDAGFSTAGRVSELAGRGIGMSVVRQGVIALQGTLSAEPGPSGGTRFRLAVPLSTASTRVVLVRAGDHVYAMPSRALSRVLRIEPGALREEEGGRSAVVLEEEGQPVPAVRLNDWLGIAVPETAGDTPRWGFLADTGGARRCVLVDEIVAVRDEIVSRIPPPGDQVAAVVGAVRLEGGVAAPCLAVHMITGETARTPRTRRAGAGTVALPHILVVDDSITTRTLERSILEARGYPVSVCVNGVEALALLRDTPVALVIADVQMPEMDGFELLERMKKDEDLAAVPVIMVTSRGSDEDRRRGLELGADAYLVKKSFDQAELLQIIGQLT